MSFPRYESYKDSGVEWLGEVPKEWDVKRLKYAADNKKFAIVDGPFGTQLKADDYREIGVPLVRISNLNYDGKFDQEDLVFIDPKKANEVSRSSITKGDVIVGKTGATIGKSALIKDFDHGIIASSCLKISPCQKALKSEFLLYCVVSEGFLKTLINTSGGSTRDTINIEPFSNLSIAIPSLPEQRIIAAFLDRETAKIDALIAEQKRLIELLKEKRQAVISHAVTKGLNRYAPMKDSGIEWLGEVPKHWDVWRLKRISPQITVGIVVEPSKYYVDEGIPALRSLNVRPCSINLDNLVYISPEANEVLSKSRLNAGDLVAVRSGQPGTTAVIPKEIDGCNCIDLIIIRKPLEGSEQFFCWYLNSDSALQQFSEGSGGAIQQHFNIGTAMNLVMTRPPKDEQFAIAAFLDRETDKLDTLIAEAQRAITLLQERRAALISAAITGKIDVRSLFTLPVQTEVAA